MTDALGTAAGDAAHTTVYTYNKRGQVTRITHPGGAFIQYAYDLHGNRTTVTDELNHATTYTYDAYRRVTTIKNALNQTSTHSYLPWNKSSSYLTTSDFVYAATAPSGKEIWNFADANLRRYRNCVGPYTGADQADTYFTYDNAGNLLTVQDPRANITTYEYDKRNRRTSMTEPAPTSGVTSWEYDAAGNMTKEIRPDDKFRRWDVYDAMNRVKHTYGFANEPTSYTYDLAGNLTRMTDSKGASYDFAYDLMNRKTSATYPPDSYDAVRYESWTYDTVGNLYRYRTPFGWLKTFAYDNRNRPTSASWNTTYGQSTGVTTTYDAASRVTSIVSGPTTVAFGYDNANRQIWEDQTLSGLPTRRVNTPVDVDGNRSATTLTGVYGLYYEYTQRQQLSVIQNAAQVEWFQFTYDKNGNLTKRQNMYQGLDSTNFQYDQYIDGQTGGTASADPVQVFGSGVGGGGGSGGGGLSGFGMNWTGSTGVFDGAKFGLPFFMGGKPEPNLDGKSNLDPAKSAKDRFATGVATTLRAANSAATAVAAKSFCVGLAAAYRSVWRDWREFVCIGPAGHSVFFCDAGVFWCNFTGVAYRL